MGTRACLQRILPTMLLALSIASATLHTARHLGWNLDGVFYAALMTTGTRPIEEVHRSVYQEIAALTPPSSAYLLTQGSANRVALQHSSERFAGQLPFYRTKPLYIALGRVFTPLGVPSILAPYVVSLLSFALLGLSLPKLAIAAGAHRSMAIVVATIAVWLPFFRELGSLATPDATSTMLLVSGAALSISQAWFGAVLLTAAALVRPDAAVLGAAIFSATQGFTPKAHQGCKLLFIIALLALPFVVPLITGGYGWAAVVRHTFLEAVTNNVEAQRSITAAEYLTALKNGAAGAMTQQPANFLPYLAVALLGWIFRPRGERSHHQRTALRLTGLMWGATLIRFIVMPLLADRFFAPAYICSLAMTTALLAPSRRSALPTPPAILSR